MPRNRIHGSSGKNDFKRACFRGRTKARLHSGGTRPPTRVRLAWPSVLAKVPRHPARQTLMPRRVLGHLGRR